MTLYCESCWTDYDRRITLAEVTINGQNLCRPCCQVEGLDPAEGVAIAQPEPKPERTPPVLRGDVIRQGEKRQRTARREAREHNARPSSFRLPPAATEKRICALAECGREFTSAHRQKKFCCPDHANRASYLRTYKLDLTPRPCDVCGQMIERPHRAQHVCSKACSDRWRNQHKAVQYPPRPCARCGEMFEPRVATALYCSKLCSRRAWWETSGRAARKQLRAREKKKYPPRTCLACGREFNPRDHRQLTCCYRCYQRWWQRENRKPMVRKAGASE